MDFMVLLGWETSNLELMAYILYSSTHVKVVQIYLHFTLP